MYTNNLTGFDPEVMPGLRPGFFGEVFLNFSYPGVAILGLLYGFALRYTDYRLKESVRKNGDVIKGLSYSITFAIMSHMAITAGMWGLYILLLIHTALAFYRKTIRARVATIHSPNR